MPSQSARFFVFKKTSGFTLIEFLVVIGLLALTVGSALIFLTSLLKGSNQAKIIAETKQNGQVVLDSLERQIRNAKFAENHPMQPTKDHIVLTVPGSSSSSFEFLHIHCEDESLAVNGWIGIHEENSKDWYSEADTGYSLVTNFNPVSGVSVKDCDFNVISASEGTGAPPIVQLKFVMNQGAQAPSRVDFIANTEFQTTISLRDY